MKHPRRKSTQVYAAVLEKSRGLLQSIAHGDCDILLNYLTLYKLYTGSSGMVAELKPLFRLPGVSVDSVILNEDVRRAITIAATQWLTENPRQQASNEQPQPQISGTVK